MTGTSINSSLESGSGPGAVLSAGDFFYDLATS